MSDQEAPLASTNQTAVSTYCVKCRDHRTIEIGNARYVTNKRGGLMLQARCPVCEKTINTFVKKQEGIVAEPLPAREETGVVKAIKKRKKRVKSVGFVVPEISPPLGSPTGGS